MSLEDTIRFDGVHILLVDDEPNLLRVVRRILRRRGAEVESAGDGVEALAKLDSFPADLILTDLKMPEMGGVELLQELRRRGIEAAVLVLTGHGTMETAIEAMRLGARDYLLKPCDPDEILLVCQRELEAFRLRRENLRLRSAVSALSKQVEQQAGYGEMVGDSPAMRELYRQIERLCRFDDLTVLLMGETGTGKELVARALHRGTRRAEHPFVAVNCAAIPADLQESQLFGHRKGSFTGAEDDYVGAFEAAHQGTLLLDEVGEMRPELQPKLLRALEEKAVTPLGRHQPLAVDVRVIAATNRDLAADVTDGRFRADLYNRLEGAVLRLPPLRERMEDLPALATHFLEAIARDYDLPAKSLAPSAIARLRAHSWPGNVRELANVMRRSFVFADGEVIAADNLHLGPPPASTGLPAAVDDGLGELERQEREMIVRTLAETGGNKSKTAEVLGIDRKKLYRRLDKYGL